ncbi:glycine zipper 2TM domain-containing protein [Thiofilum flexile]|uniref:glycine zipper 2TM domain-containing protein n=1 Tax=Thiofilum flexile TaxID=125627 RepID=UPI00036EEE75|nr:glycine zipper 2TM domain-containing protein [Thiofilum flexile]
MKKYIAYSVTIAATLTILSLTGCAAPASHTQNGAVAGSVVGGVVGHQFGKGDGKKAATVAGAIAGGYIGGNMGAQADQYYQQPQYNGRGYYY